MDQINALDTCSNRAISRSRYDLMETRPNMTMAYAGISFIQPPPPPPPTLQQTLGTTWREQKPFSRDNHCAQKSSSQNKINRESKAPPLRQSIYKRISIKLSHYLKWKALWSQQIKRFFNEEITLIVIAYIIWQSPEHIKAIHHIRHMFSCRPLY